MEFGEGSKYWAKDTSIPGRKIRSWNVSAGAKLFEVVTPISAIHLESTRDQGYIVAWKKKM